MDFWFENKQKVKEKKLPSDIKFMVNRSICFSSFVCTIQIEEISFSIHQLFNDGLFAFFQLFFFWCVDSSAKLVKEVSAIIVLLLFLARHFDTSYKFEAIRFLLLPVSYFVHRSLHISIT